MRNNFLTFVKFIGEKDRDKEKEREKVRERKREKLTEREIEDREKERERETFWFCVLHTKHKEDLVTITPPNV